MAHVYRGSIGGGGRPVISTMFARALMLRPRTFAFGGLKTITIKGSPADSGGSASGGSGGGGGGTTVVADPISTLATYAVNLGGERHDYYSATVARRMLGDATATSLDDSDTIGAVMDILEKKYGM